MSTGPASSVWGFPPGKAIWPAWLLRLRARLVSTSRRIPSVSVNTRARTAAVSPSGRAGSEA